jgi:hypothetical protein
MQGYRIYRHYHMGSEAFTGGDSLLTALQLGWEICSITSEVHDLRGGRTTTVYRLRLTRKDEAMVMAVLACPFVARLIAPITFHQDLGLTRKQSGFMAVDEAVPASAGRRYLG